ncbi:MFS transporter [Halococcus hamelinensis]|uniref:Major facilitator superfamily protein n=1 Tax=Halococcus hamelinensis 100A6 TaxID=1132509 RepID=M0M063_9EURY|nr:MFS transporter [Halococcus hamelinensis]EMA39051.1 major facilitator superfamily protein [Halococcus hamelinensis 100A6]
MRLFDTDRRVLTLAFARMADSIGNSFLIIVLPLYIGSGVVTGQTFGLGVALVTGIILSAFGFFSTALQPIAGYLSDRTGSRRIFIVVGLLILTVANFVYSLVDSYALMLAIRGLQGIGVAITIPSTVALVNEVTTDDSRGGDMGIFNTFRFVGFAAGPILAGSVVNGGPYRVAGLAMTGFETAFYIAALGSLIGAVLIMLFVEDPHPDEQDAEAGSDIGFAVFDHDHDTLIDPVFALGLALLTVAIGIALIEPLQTDINNHLDQGAQLFSIEFSAFIVAQVFLQTPIGTASDRYGRRPFILGGLIVLVPAMLAQGLVTTPIGMIATRLVQGAAAATAFAPGFALAGDIAQDGNSGTTFSVLTMAFTLGTAIGPLLAGYLISFGYVVPFAFGAVLSALGALLVYSQVEETHATAAETPGGAQPASQD